MFGESSVWGTEMVELPKHIADLCGILDVKEIALGWGRYETQSPLRMTQEKDDQWIVTYNNEEIGCITRIRKSKGSIDPYAAVSIYGSFQRCSSFHEAKSFLMEECI